MNVSNGGDSVEQDTKNKTGTVGNEFEETVTNESNASVGMELEENVMGESNADCSPKEDTSMNRSVTNELGTNVMNKSSGDLSLNVDISNTGSVGQELGRKVMNPSNCDSSVKDGTNNIKAFGKESQIANEIQVDKEVRQEKKEKVVVIEIDRGENCETLNFISGSEIVTGEKERRINSLNPVESSRNKIEKVTDDDKDDASNSQSQVVTVEKETRANSLIPVASGERVVTCGDQCNDSECDRSPIKKVISDEKEDTLNSESHAHEKINSSDVDSSDDENLPLSKLKMISCQRQDIRQVENPLNLVCYPNSTSEETKSNGEGDKTNIDQIIERLQDTQDRESPPMSMEEYRLTYTKEIFETAINDEQTIIKETRNLVNPAIYSQSDTTATRGTSYCGNDSSDSEPDIVIYRNKNNSQKKKKKT